MISPLSKALKVLHKTLSEKSHFTSCIASKEKINGKLKYYFTKKKKEKKESYKNVVYSPTIKLSFG